MRSKFVINGLFSIRMVKIMSVAILLFAGIAITGCEKSNENHRGEVPTDPDNGGRDEPVTPPADPDSIERPGIGDKGDDYSKELADATWRYVGGDVELRYSTGGILFSIKNHKSTKTIKITDIDGTNRLSCEMGAIKSDSVLTESSLNVNGEKIELSRIKFKNASGDTEWYHIMAADGGNHVLVVPVGD